MSHKTDGGGVLIGVRKCLRASPAPGFNSDAEDVCLSVECAIGCVFVCCVYLPPGDPESISVFLRKMSSIRDAYPDNLILIVGDFNLPNIVWYRWNDGNLVPSGGGDLRSGEFLETYRYCNLWQFNDISNDNLKILDLILSSTACIQEVKSCPDPLVGLDRHHPAVESLVDGARPKELRDDPTLKYFFNRVDYETFNNVLLDHNWSDRLVGRSVDDAVSVFYSTIHDLIDAHVPHRQLPKRRFPIWYSASTMRAIREKLRFHRRWKIYGDRADYLTFTILHNRTKTLTKSDYDNYIKSIQSQLIECPDRLWSCVKHRRGGCAGIPTTMKFCGVHADNSQDICSLFALYFNSVFIDGNPSVPSRVMPIGGFAPWFGEEDVLCALNKVDAKAGDGPDKLPGSNRPGSSRGGGTPQAQQDNSQGSTVFKNRFEPCVSANVVNQKFARINDYIYPSWFI
ncbi:uncharacterized protein [Onthophagus taurus]|uniref:uncharacterized protein n=1 Tax=Onthophagus taurus TaxID=166361 RepID=UPI0039BE4B66